MAVSWASLSGVTFGNDSHATSGKPNELSDSDWGGIRAAYEAARHEFRPTQQGWQAENPGQQWTTTFDQRGFLAQPKNASWTWGLELCSYGFAGQERSHSRPAVVATNGQRLTYTWDANLEEWFVNDRRGLEHGFTVKSRSGLGPAAVQGYLAFTLAVRGSLRPEITADAQAVNFLNEAGARVLTYSGLKVWDADGKTLPSRFESAGDKSLRLLVDERSARYPITIDPIAQQAYLKPATVGTTQERDFFGSSVAVSGDTVVVGAPHEDSSTTGINSVPNEGALNAGAAYVFVRSGGAWSQQAYLKPAAVGTTQVYDRFGSSVAVSDDTIVIGAPSERSSTTGINSAANESADDAGAAYVFVRSGAAWSQQAYLKPAAVGISQVYDWFGSSVAVSGDTVVVGAYLEESSTTGINSSPNEGAPAAGAAYVFVRSGAAWSQQAYLKPAAVGTTQDFDYFGYSVAVSGDTVVVGAPYEDSSTTGINSSPNEGAPAAGAAYVFVRSGAAWSQQAYLKPAAVGISQVGDEFGSSVAVSGDTVVVGTPDEDSSTTGINSSPNEIASESGAAFVFVRSGETWSQQAYLKPDAVGRTQSGDKFGISVAVSGDTLVVGAMDEDSSTTGINSTPNDDFTLRYRDAGAAYVFVRSARTWSQQAYLKPAAVGTTQEGESFGVSVAVSGDAVVVGASNERSSTTGIDSTPNESAARAGAAYVFTASGLATPPSPVVFIPGIAGSVLRGPDPDNPDQDIDLWPTLSPDNLDQLNLTANIQGIRAVDIVRRYDPLIFGIRRKIVYEPLVDYFTSTLGMREFALGGDPSRMTSSYMTDLTWSAADRPNFFPFPYDWRQDNRSHLSALRAYITNIRNLHGGAKVHVVAHSMGGLVLRHYALQYPEDIEKAVTIGSPFWGAPKMVYRLLTGEFYDIGLVDWVTNNEMRGLIASLPSTAQLIPPFRTGHVSEMALLLGEQNWDLNGNHTLESFYSPSTFWQYIETVAPGFDAWNAGLHTNRQDNWSNDTNGISWLHIAGNARDAGRLTTTTYVQALERIITHRRGAASRQKGFFENVTEGDNVVPLESAILGDESSSFRAPGAQSFVVEGNLDAVEHTNLTQNSQVHAKFAEFLGLTAQSGEPIKVAPLALAQAGAVRMRCVALYGCGYVPIRDAAGNENTRLSSIAVKRIPGFRARYDGINQTVWIEGEEAKEISLESPAETMNVEAEIIGFDVQGIQESLRRYRFEPDQQAWRLRVSANETTLELDNDRDGAFQPGEIIAPIYSASGLELDVFPPSLTMSISPSGEQTAVTIEANDMFTMANPSIKYQINDGPLLTYSEPLTLLNGQRIKAYAEDAAGNSSGMIDSTVAPEPDITQGTQQNSVKLEWPVAELYVLEQADSPAGPWSRIDAASQRNDTRESTVISVGTGKLKFFRLTSKTVTK